MSVEKIRYKKGYKYQLVQTYRIMTGIKPDDDIQSYYLNLSKRGELTIRRGYAWDGPSGPTIDTKNFMRGSLVHDALYQLMRQGLLPGDWRHEADKELRRICLEDGMSRFRAWLVYRGVRLGASYAASPRNKKPVLTAP